MDNLIGYGILDGAGRFIYGPDSLAVFETLEKAKAAITTPVGAGWWSQPLTIVGLVVVENR